MEHRKLSNITTCPRCEARAETLDHLFRECPVTIDVWIALSFQGFLLDQSMDFVQWITWVFEQLNPCQSRLFCCALWAIWRDRNKRIHEGKVSNGKETANFINNYINELTHFERRKSTKITGKQRWQHPHREFIKINFDGAYHESQYCSAIGIVARDAEGRVLLSYSELQKDITSAFAAEAIACWRAVQIGVDREWQSVIF
ncbi:hypothetical protein GOBAR_DD27593 [Gossypium barbadense]|nr:hypothetical protein GOBAR_DD27593 [Gossypium barbadense]